MLSLSLKALPMVYSSRKFKENSHFLSAIVCQAWLFIYVISFNLHNCGKWVTISFFKEIECVHS